MAKNKNKKEKTEEFEPLNEIAVEKSRRNQQAAMEEFKDINDTNKSVEDVWSQEEIEAALEKYDYISQKLSEGRYRIAVRQKCGHISICTIKGKMLRTREKKVTKLSESNCWECRVTEAMSAAQDNAYIYDLPPIIGSEKQIKWATVIRDEKVRQFVHAIEGVDAKDAEPIIRIFNMILSIRSSKFWIEHRNYDLIWLLDEYDIEGYREQIRELLLELEQVKKENKKLEKLKEPAKEIAELKKELTQVRRERAALKNKIKRLQNKLEQNH